MMGDLKAAPFSAEDFRLRAAIDRGPFDALDHGDHRFNPGHPRIVEPRQLRDAAVLIPVVDHRPEATVILTKRAETLTSHSGQVAFPGGRIDPTDLSPEAAALREAHEEIGLAPAAVDLVGALPPVGTMVTGFRVYPFVGVIEPGHVWVPQESEVAQVLELSLADLRSGQRLERLIRRGVPFKTTTYTVDGHLVWGATARIVGQLLDRLAPLLS